MGITHLLDFFKWMLVLMLVGAAVVGVVLWAVIFMIWSWMS